MFFYVCKPKNFKLTVAINKAEEEWIKKGIDKNKLNVQHDTFCKLIKNELNENDSLVYIEENSKLYEQTFVRDIAFEADKIFITKIATKVREKETLVAPYIFKNRDYVEMNNNIEGGDVISLKKYGKKILFVGISSRTSIEAIEELKTKTTYQIIPIRLKKDILHLDCVLGIIDNTHALVYKDGIAEDDFSIIQKHFETIEINKQEQLNMGANILNINNSIFIDSRNIRIIKILKNLGFKVIPVDYDEFSKLGGSLHCCCLDITSTTKGKMDIKKHYITYRNNQAYYRNINLYDLVNKFGCPLKVGYVPAIRDSITWLKNCFDNSCSKYSYEGKYIYALANKSNYYSEIVSTGSKYSDYVETSSYTDLLLIERVLSTKYFAKKPILCNGNKDDSYIDQIVKMHNQGYKIICIIDSLKEYKRLSTSSIKGKMEIGLRINLKNIYKKNEKEVDYDRFGLEDSHITWVLDNLDKEKFYISTIHYHQRTSRFYEDKALYNIKYIFENYYAKLINKIDTLVNFNLGGGVPYDKIGEHDYQTYADNIVKLIKELCDKYKVKHPNIIQENGRYTTSDSGFNIYEVTDVKNVNGNTWYIINDSFVTTLPNSWALHEDFLLLPVNLTENKMIEVCLAGNTCDGDDVYYFQNENSKIYMPEIKEGQKLYIAVFGMGAYQEILSGIGGIHHCLNREEHDLVIYHQNNKLKYYKVRGRQPIKQIFKRLKYTNYNLRKYK